MSRLSVVTPPPDDLERSVEDYLLSKHAQGNVSRMTIRQSYGYPLRASLLPWCQAQGISEPQQLDQAALNRWAIHLEEVGGKTKRLSPATIWTYRKAANQYLRWLHEVGAPQLKLGGDCPVKDVFPLERSEMMLMERVALRLGSERNSAAIRLLSDTAMRSGELIKLRHSDLRKNARRYWVHITADSRTKGGDRDVVLAPELYKRLERLAGGPGGDPGAPVFTSEVKSPRTNLRGKMTLRALQRTIQVVAAEAGLSKEVTPYTFRYSACTWLIRDKRLSPSEVEKIMGHSSLRMIMSIYAKISMDDANDALLAAVLEG